jgi:hypothetical protein
VKRTCGGRTCPYCSWVRATERVELLRYAAGEFPEIDGHVWQLVTVNPQYDKEKKSPDMSIEGIRSRALRLMKACREMWSKALNTEGAALMRCIEISESGHVHAHLIYYGPMVDVEELQSIAVKGCRRPAMVDSKKIKGGKKGVARATRYAAKSVKGSAAAFDEDFLAGDKAGRLLDPELAARWELASHNLRLTECYGALRGLQVPRPDEKGGPHDDGAVQCDCGSTGQFETIYKRVFDYLVDCHFKGKAGLEGNRWLPYWMRENVRKKKLRKRERQRRKCK